MESRMTIVQALDERELLVKKIGDKIQKAQLVDLIRPKAALTVEKRLARGEFEAQAQGALQQILDLIDRYDKLNAAVSQSNAVTFLETSRGKMSVGAAIALRGRLRGSGPYGELSDFEGKLFRKLEECYRTMCEQARKKNEAARRASAPLCRGKAVGKTALLVNADSAALRSAKPGEERSGAAAGTVGQGISKGPEPLRVFDPLNVRKRAETLEEEREALLLELDAKIKMSNATTFITV